MSLGASDYTRARLSDLARIQGVAFQDRIWRNMLSSQPMAFSIVGELRTEPTAALEVVGRMIGTNLQEWLPLKAQDYTLDGLEAEWFPPRALHTNDRSGFDIAMAALTDTGRTILITIEVKYTDKFSKARLDPNRYTAGLKAAGLDVPATLELVNAGCSQFLRSVLLTHSVARTNVMAQGPRFDQAIAVVLAKGDDNQATEVVERLQAAGPPVGVAFWSHEGFFSACAAQPGLEGWGADMLARYVPGHW